MSRPDDVIATLRSALNLGPRTASFDRSTALLGSLPELDSMAVVSLLTAIEERFGIVIEDDEVDGQIFATVGSLADFVDSKLTS